jgi:hypothetical protein
METFVKSSEGILCEITLHPGAVATNISGYSVHPEESEVLIAAMSGFVVESVDYGSDRDEDATEGQHKTLDSRIPKVKLHSWLSWVDFDMEAVLLSTMDRDGQRMRGGQHAVHHHKSDPEIRPICILANKITRTAKLK